MRDIDINDNIIDSRDIEKRIDELEAKVEDLPEEERASSDEAEELKMWREFREEAATSEWSYGVAFIADTHFTEYAQEMAEDIGAVGKDMQWPLSFIDWDAAADALKQDYSSVEVDGFTFWYRD